MLKKIAKSALLRLDLTIVKASEWEACRRNLIDALPIQLQREFPLSEEVFWTFVNEGKAQLRQDLVAAAISRGRREGFFVEFGATDGITLSNTYLLEKTLGWRGILAEPGRIWHTALAANRTATLDFRAVFSESGRKIEFLEAQDPELSTLSDFKESDHHNRVGTFYTVDTVSLMDLLAHHNAPQNVDYLSIDTEGSEHEILKNFDFSSYNFGFISVEHNFGAQREKIFDLLGSNGYERIFPDFSGWDDWYMPAS